MARAHRGERYLKDIRTMAELREAQTELLLRSEWAGERLADDTSRLFSLEGLLSIVAPPGSVGGRIMNGFSTGMAFMRGVGGVFRGKARGHHGFHGGHGGMSCGCGPDCGPDCDCGCHDHDHRHHDLGRHHHDHDAMWEHHHHEMHHDSKSSRAKKK